MQHHWTVQLVFVLTPVVIYTKVYSVHDPAQMCVKYLPWLSWSWLHHPVCWPQRSLSSGSCTCWSLVPASGFLWHTNHVVGTFTTFVYSSMAKSTLNLIYTEYKWHVILTSGRCWLKWGLPTGNITPHVYYTPKTSTNKFLTSRHHFYAVKDLTPLSVPLEDQIPHLKAPLTSNGK